MPLPSFVQQPAQDCRCEANARLIRGLWRPHGWSGSLRLVRGREEPFGGHESGSANTKRLLAKLGFSSGVRRNLIDAPLPVLTATYWRPSTA